MPVSGLEHQEGHRLSPGRSTDLILSHDTRVCVCASHVHTHMNLRGDSMYRSTQTQTCMLHTPALRLRGKHEQSLVMCTLVPTLTHAHVSPFRRILTFLLHACRTQSHSHGYIYNHTVCQNISVPYAHTPSCTNTQIHAAHTHVHTHSCVQLCTHSYPLYTHRAQLHTHVHKSTFTYARIRQAHSGSHTSPYPVHKTYLHKYM